MQIEQIDRDAAADSSPHNGRWGSLVRAGALDRDPLVQAFAYHRVKAIAAHRHAAPDDAVERIVDAVIDAANIVSHDGYYEIDRDAATRAAIAALGGGGC